MQLFSQVPLPYIVKNCGKFLQPFFSQILITQVLTSIFFFTNRSYVSFYSKKRNTFLRYISLYSSRYINSLLKCTYRYTRTSSPLRNKTSPSYPPAVEKDRGRGQWMLHSCLFLSPNVILVPCDDGATHGDNWLEWGNGVGILDFFLLFIRKSPLPLVSNTFRAFPWSFSSVHKANAADSERGRNSNFFSCFCWWGKTMDIPVTSGEHLHRHTVWYCHEQ